MISGCDITCYDRNLKRSWSTLQTSTGKSCMCKSDAVGERSFSAARKLKTWLRSTMTQERFSNLKQPQKENRHICLAEVANILKFAVRNYKTGKKISVYKESTLPPPPPFKGSGHRPPHFKNCSFRGPCKRLSKATVKVFYW